MWPGLPRALHRRVDLRRSAGRQQLFWIGHGQRASALIANAEGFSTLGFIGSGSLPLAGGSRAARAARCHADADLYSAATRGE